MNNNITYTAEQLAHIAAGTTFPPTHTPESARAEIASIRSEIEHLRDCRKEAWDAGDRESYRAYTRDIRDLNERIRAYAEAYGVEDPTRDPSCYNDRYQKENIRRVVVKVNRKTQPDIAAHLDGIDNVQGYILDLIRADLNK